MVLRVLKPAICSGGKILVLMKIPIKITAGNGQPHKYTGRIQITFCKIIRMSTITLPTNILINGLMHVPTDRAVSKRERGKTQKNAQGDVEEKRNISEQFGGENSPIMVLMESAGYTPTATAKQIPSDLCRYIDLSAKGTGKGKRTPESGARLTNRALHHTDLSNKNKVMVSRIWTTTTTKCLVPKLLPAEQLVTKLWPAMLWIWCPMERLAPIHMEFV